MKRFMSDTLDRAREHKKEGAQHEAGKPSEGECLVHVHASSMVEGKEWATVSVGEDHPLYMKDEDGCQIPHVIPAEQLRNDPALHV
jgi:hypothetical protein